MIVGWHYPTLHSLAIWTLAYWPWLILPLWVCLSALVWTATVWALRRTR